MRFEVPNKGHIGRTLLEKLSPEQIASGMTEPGRVNHALCGIVVEITAGGHRDTIAVDVDPQVSLKTLHAGKAPLSIPVLYSVDDLPDCQKVLPTGADVSLALELAVEVTLSTDDDLILSFVDHKEKMDISAPSEVTPTLRIKSVILDAAPVANHEPPAKMVSVCYAVIPPGISAMPETARLALDAHAVIQLKTIEFTASRRDESGTHPVHIRTHHPVDNPQISMLAFARCEGNVYKIDYPVTIGLHASMKMMINATVVFQYDANFNQVDAYLRGGSVIDVNTGERIGLPDTLVVGLDHLIIAVG